MSGPFRHRVSLIASLSLALVLLQNADLFPVRLMGGERVTKTPNELFSTRTDSPISIPNVLLAGVQKGGTTSAWEYLRLSQEPLNNFCTGSKIPGLEESLKEVHFFDRGLSSDENGLSDAERYAQMFDQDCPLQETRRNAQEKTTVPLVFIDATPNYMHYPEKVRKLYDEHGTADELRIIFILREPMARELSWYKHKRRLFLRQPKTAPSWQKQGIVNESGKFLSFEESMSETILLELQALEHNEYTSDGPESLQGVYAPLLERWFSLFSRKRILVMSYVEMISSPATFQRRLDQFLSLRPSTADDSFMTEAAVPMPVLNRDEKRTIWNSWRKPVKPPCEVLERVYGWFQPHNEKLYTLLEQNPGPSMEQRPFPRFAFNCS